ncbi:MAG: VTT domain-containing protein [Pyrinomonadaceae bacterium]
MSLKQSILLLAVICVVATALVVRVLGLIDQTELQAFIERAGIWAPVVYIAVYIVATSLLLPSTALNVTGGALFGPLWGVVWTSIGAILAAIISFLFTRTIGYEMVNRKFGNRWLSMHEEVRRNGLSYIFAIRLLPIFPTA